jgi:hypothetical protein
VHGLGFFFFWGGRVKYGFDSGWGFCHAGLGYFCLLVNGSVMVGLSVLWVGSKLRVGF